MKNTLHTLFNIEPGEEKLVTLNWLQSFFVGCPKLFTLMVANSLFLQHYSAEDLPFIYLASSLVVPLTGFIHLYFEKKLSFIKLQVSTLVILSVFSCTFFILLSLYPGNKWLIVALYIWLAVELAMADIILWSAANRMFTVRQSKRLFGFIGAGAIFTVVIGGFLTPFIIGWISTSGLLILSTIGFVLALCNLIVMHHFFRNKFTEEVKPSTPKAPIDSEISQKNSSSSGSQSLAAMFKNRYLILIFLVFAFFSQTIYLFVDNIFYQQMGANFHNADALASFIGQFWAFYGILSLLFRSFLAGRWMTNVGLLGGLMTSQVVVGICMGFLLFYNTLGLNTTVEAMVFFWLVAVTKQLERILTGAVTSPAYLTLYQPLSRTRRMRVQTLTESVVGPVGGMLTSLLLLLLTKLLGLETLQLAMVLLLIIGAYGIVCHATVKNYRTALTKALNRKGLVGTELSLDDNWSGQILEKGLESHRPKEILYCLKLLEDVNHPNLKVHLYKLLEHHDAEVREGIYQIIERLGFEDAYDHLATHLQVEHQPVLRGKLLRALAATGEIEAFDIVEPYLDDKAVEVRQGAMVGLVRYCGIEGAVSAGSTLMALQKSPSSAERQFAATVLGEIGISTFYRGLLSLLQDESVEVRRAALIAAGQLDNYKLWPLVIENLGFLPTREAAVKALLQARESAFKALEESYENTDSFKIRREIIHLYGRIKGKGAIRLLQGKLLEPNRNLRYEMLWSLYLCGYNVTSEEELQNIETLLKDERDYGTHILAAQYSLQQQTHSLMSALNYELKKVRMRLFLLLATIYPSEVIMKIWNNFSEDSIEKRDLALELLDNTVNKDHKSFALPILENNQRSYHHDDTLSSAERVLEIMTTPELWDNTWTRACAINDVRYLPMLSGLSLHLQALAEDADALIRETAAYVLESLRTPQNNTVMHKVQFQRGNFPTVEKVKMLKAVSIFSEIPDEILAEASPFLEPLELSAQECVFKKGELGTSMYIIVDGLLRVHDGEMTLAELGAGNIFGEFSALDPEPRTASITTIKPSYLFRLSQEELNNLMESHLEVAKGIIQILCQRLRNSLQQKKATMPAPPPKSSPDKPTEILSFSHEEDQLSLIEKVIILKTVSIFADTPDNILSEVATMTTEKFLHKDEMLFQKGEVGTSMYIVVSGKVRVHDGEQTIAKLGERALIGEMAVLSSEPRTASITALNDTLLLSLTQTALFELMWDQHKIVRGIIQVLIQRLRSLRKYG